MIAEVFPKTPLKRCTTHLKRNIISDVDDRDYLASLIKATIPALPKPKLKKNPMK